MKRNIGGNNSGSKQFVNQRNRPENKDDIDSREGEEQNIKGDDVTHNKKETKKNHLKQKKDNKSD
jgi:hypothetical protein